MAASDMKELLKHELGDLLYAEQLILKMLGTLTREVQNPEMLARVKEHIGETEEQIERLRRAFESVGEKAKAEKCDAAIGLKEEHDSFKKEKPSKALLEAFDLGNSLRVEHYEIAGYRSAIAVATALGQRECVALLSESLREEEAMATFIERSSVKALKGLAAGMDLASGAAEVVLTVGTGSSRSRSTAAKSSARKSSGSSSRSSSGKSNGRSTTADSGSSGSRSSSSKSGGSKSSTSKSGGGSKSAGSSSASRSPGGSASKTGGSKSGSSSSRSRSSKSGSGSSART